MNSDYTNKLSRKIHELLDKKEGNEQIISNVIVEIREAIKSDNSLGKSLGPYIYSLKKLVTKNVDFKEFLSRKQKYNAEEKRSNLIQIENGFLMIGHRPKSIPILKTINNIDIVVTLLSKKEKAENIGATCKQNDIEWFWLELEDGNYPAKSRYNEISELFITLKKNLNNGKKIFIHCSAGMHRTGMITYAFLLFLGYKEKEAFELLYKLRAVTAHEVRQKRLNWGIEFVNQKT